MTFTPSDKGDELRQIGKSPAAPFPQSWQPAFTGEIFAQHCATSLFLLPFFLMSVFIKTLLKQL
jgi:hypothetical protein